MRAIRYKSSDGLEIPAYLTLPKGLEAKNLPLVVVPHGGPWGRDSRGFNGMAMIMSIEKFLAKHLGGRFQEGGTAETVQRLKEITVDVKTVTMAKKPDTNAKAAVDVSGKWTMIAEAPGQTVELLMELKQTDNSFNGTISSAIGGGTVESGTVKGNAVQGTAKVNVQGQDIDVQIDGTVEGDTMKGTLNSPFGLIPFTATKNK